jgi:hypothetical protein
VEFHQLRINALHFPISPLVVVEMQWSFTAEHGFEVGAFASMFASGRLVILTDPTKSHVQAEVFGPNF